MQQTLQIWQIQQFNDQSLQRVLVKNLQVFANFWPRIGQFQLTNCATFHLKCKLNVTPRCNYSCNITSQVNNFIRFDFTHRWAPVVVSCAKRYLLSVLLILVMIYTIAMRLFCNTIIKNRPGEGFGHVMHMQGKVTHQNYKYIFNTRNSA